MQTSQTDRSPILQVGDVVEATPTNRAHWEIIILVAFGALFDAVEQYNSGYAAPSLEHVWHITSTEVGLLSTFTFGAMTIGSLLAGLSGDYLGRKFTYMYNLLLYTVGALIGAFAPDITVLYIGRIIVGLGLGGELNTGLTIVSELVPTRLRGSATAIVNVAAGGAGIFLSAALAFLILGPLGPTLGGIDSSWRWLLGLLVIPAVLIWFYRRYIPESPRYLASRGRIDDANQILSMLAAKTLKPIREVTEYIHASAAATSPDPVRISDVFRGPFRRRTIVLWIISWMTFGGQVTITTFLPTLLVSEGFTVVHSLLYSTIINIGGLVGAILASLFAAFVPRRAVLGGGAVLAIGIALLFSAAHGHTAILLLGGLMQLMFILLNTSTWLYSPELYPTRVRAFGTGAAVVVALVSATLTPLIAGPLFSSFQGTGLLGLIAVMYAIMAVAMLGFGTETRGKSLEQLTENL